ncbi:hypothetical protein BH10ACT9_BH10ACT9_17740 [soil metagenome]
MAKVKNKTRALPKTHLERALSIPRDFVINEVPFDPDEAVPTPADNAPSLGPLAAFQKTFIGRGFNMIFRPQHSSSPTQLPVPQPDSDNILELNLTIETLSFQSPLGAVPNRGELQADIFLNGVPYLQSISDVTDPTRTTPIHLEPGIFLIVPSTTVPAVPETVVRMASIPHGTTINAQGTFLNVPGGPRLDPIDITPFPIGNPDNRIRFPSQDVTTPETPRIPQDLSVAPTITQALLDDPVTMLRDHIQGMTILSNDVLFFDTKAEHPGGGTDNIAFLVGDAAGPNADAIEMSSIFWIEVVEAQLEVKPLKAGSSRTVSPPVPAGAPAPSFVVTAETEIYDTRFITVTYTQIQYVQNVALNFAGLTWPHVSVATLVPSEAIKLSL